MRSIIFYIALFVGTPLALRLPTTPQQELNTGFLKEQLSTKAYDLCRVDDGSNLHLTPRQDLSVRPPSHGYNITLVTTSVGESDKLEASLRCNKDLVHQMIVLTHGRDKKTQRVCDKMGARCYATNAFYENNATFNKGRALNELQRELHPAAQSNSVMMLVDSDICLPSSFSESLPSEMAHDFLYSGVERCMYESPEAYSRGWPAVQAKWDLVTMGFLQIYRAHSKAPLYPTEFPTAGESDIKYADYFKQRETLPLIVMHMGISPDPDAWKGTKARNFDWATATLPPEGACPACAQKTEHCFLGKDKQQHCKPI